MPEINLNEKSTAILNSILRQGFRFGDVQPMDINQVIFRLIDIADGEGYLMGEAESIFYTWKQEGEGL